MLVAIAIIAGGGLVVADEQMPTLTPAEVKDGWKLLFDGKSLAGWQGYKGRPTSGWKPVDGVLVREAGGGDLVTTDEFASFELRLEWKLNKGGNSGIFFHVTDEGDEAWHSGPEFQVLDNGGHKDGAAPLTSAGSNYAVHPPVRDVTKSVGEWNSVRLIVRGAHVEHWMNDVKLLEYELWSPDWAARVKASKFDKIPIYGRAKSGRIGLQDHGDVVWYRNIKIRPL
jgi:Domain of Unknown Function (DUF1080)